MLSCLSVPSPLLFLEVSLQMDHRTLTGPPRWLSSPVLESQENLLSPSIFTNSPPPQFWLQGWGCHIVCGVAASTDLRVDETRRPWGTAQQEVLPLGLPIGPLRAVIFCCFLNSSQTIYSNLPKASFKQL